jgi:hypothetical protein
MSVHPVEAPTAMLNHSHRCDRCGSRAYVLTALKWNPMCTGPHELLWCRHHWNQHHQAIAPYVSVEINELWQLTEHIRDTGHWVEGKEARP